MKQKIVLLSFFMMALCFAASANTGPGTGEDSKKTDIAGGVFHADTKKPIGNVSVTAYSNSKKEKVVTTDNSGNYYFTDLKPGTYKLVFEKSGLKKVTREKVVIRGDEGCQINIEMDNESEFNIIPGQLFFSDF